MIRRNKGIVAFLGAMTLLIGTFFVATGIGFGSAQAATVRPMATTTGTSYVWSSWRNCSIITDDGTVLHTYPVRWLVEYDGVNNRRRVRQWEINPNGSYIDTLRAREARAGTNVGTGYTASDLNRFSIYRTPVFTTGQMPFITNNYTATFQMRVGRARYGEHECAYNHSF